MDEILVARISGKEKKQFRDIIYFAGYFFLFASICLLIQWKTSAYTSDHGQTGDESAYFVTSLMIADYLGSHVFSSPLAFAKEYYAHFPRVALGHYPPMFETVQAFLFLMLGRNGVTAAIFQAIAGGLCAGLPAALIGRAFGIFMGFFAGVIVICSPDFLFLISTDMADIFLAVLITLTALAWAQFYRDRKWRSAFLFSVFAVASTLTKGTALGLILLPVIHLAFKRDMKFLWDRKTLACGVLVAAAAIPWYVFTYKMAAAGFVYTWGIGYTGRAIPFFLLALVGSVSIPISILYLAGLYFSIFGRVGENLFVHGFAAASLSMIIFPMIVPAALAGRYVIPAIPSVVIVALWAVNQLPKKVPFLRTHRVLSVVLCGLLVLLSAVSIYRNPHLEPFHSELLAARILGSEQKNPLVLVSAGNLVEGAVISSFAEQDRLQQHFVVRGSEVLSKSSFMGANYQERFGSPSAMAQWIKKSEIGWVIVENPNAQDDLPHSEMLREALASDLLKSRLIMTIPNRRNQGEELQLYALSAVNVMPKRTNPIFLELKPSVKL